MMKQFVLTTAIFGLAASLGCGGAEKTQESTTPSVAAPAPKAPAKADPEPAAEPSEPASAEAAVNLSPVVYFEFDSTALSDESRTRRTNNASWLKQNAAANIKIEGHTDEKGTTQYNIALGERRAQVARDYLLRLGVASARIKIISYGEEQPASEQDDRNRRDMFVLLKSK